MKLCRFEKADEPGVARSGFAYEGRVIETDGTQAIETYAGSDVRLLAPIGRANSVRIFHLGKESFDYVHPVSMFGPNQSLVSPPGQALSYVPCIAAILVGKGSNVPPAVADDLVMGLALAHVFSTGKDGGARYDAGFALGPAIVTPDEFETGSIRPESGQVYPDTVAIIQNSVELARFELEGLRPTIGQAISSASQTQTVSEGDLILVPLGDPDLSVGAGDELRLTSPRLGTLIVKIG